MTPFLMLTFDIFFVETMDDSSTTLGVFTGFTYSLLKDICFLMSTIRG